MAEQERTKIKKDAMIEALHASLGIVTTACKNAEIARVTYYEWLKDDPQFKERVDDISNVALDFAESQLHLKMQGVRKKDKNNEVYYKSEPDTTAIIFFLKTKGKGRGYIERSELDVMGFDQIIVKGKKPEQ